MKFEFYDGKNDASLLLSVIMFRGSDRLALDLSFNNCLAGTVWHLSISSKGFSEGLLKKSCLPSCAIEGLIGVVEAVNLLLSMMFTY